MIKEIGQRTLENVRDGLRTGADFAMDRAQRIEFRKPWVYRNPRKSFLGGRSWLLGIVLLSSLAAVVAGILYSRKRKQIAERYSMGGPEGRDSMNGRQMIRDESLTSATP